MKKRILLSIIFIIGATLTYAQDYFYKKIEDFKIKPILAVQLWGTYTMHQTVYNENTMMYEAADNRMDVMIRRSRFGFSAQPYKNLKVKAVMAMDGVGRDALSAVPGPANNGSSPIIRVWDFMVDWRVMDNEHLRVQAGYFVPQFSRESITSPWKTTSMEKSFSQGYIRRHLTGIGPGRTTGIALAGVILNEKKNLGLSYSFGMFNPNYTAYGGASMGMQVSPLFTGRAVLYIGDPEMEKYTNSLKVNFFNKRKGISIAMNGAYQDGTDLFSDNYSVATDVLFNWGALNIDGEWAWLWRSGERVLPNDGIRQFTYGYQTGYFRAGYNFIIQNKYLIEPMFMVKMMNGGLEEVEQADADAVDSFSGVDNTYDVGVNWFIDGDKMVLKLHYTWNEGQAGFAGNGATVNDYFLQKPIGAIHRGNYLALGLEAKF